VRTDADKPSQTYGDGCATAQALDVIGTRWALLIVRELLFGPKRFGDLQAGLPNVRPNMLTQRLRDLEAATVLRRRKLGPPASTWVYELTDWGRELGPVLITLGRWGHGSPYWRSDTPASVDSLLLAIEGRFDPDRAGDLDTTIGLTAGAEQFLIRATAGRVTVTGEQASTADATLETDPATLRALVIDGESPSDAEHDGRLRLTGDRSAVERLLGAIRTPAS
jgi:DNA-binding HxlR family transcriptional regulator